MAILEESCGFSQIADGSQGSGAKGSDLGLSHPLGVVAGLLCVTDFQMRVTIKLLVAASF